MVEAILGGDPSLSPAERAAKILGGTKATKTSGGWTTLCPAHDDRHPSLSLANKKDGGLLAHCHAGCTQEQVIEALRSRGIEPAGREVSTRRKRIELPYNYFDEDGTLLYQNVRIETHDGNGRRLRKTFMQRRPDPDHPGKWLNDLKGVRRVPYGLRDLIARANDDVHCTEGEKDAETLAKLGLCAVSIADPKIDLGAFKDRRVYVHKDNDKAGRVKANALAQALYEIADSVCVVSYAEAGPGGDVTDWLAQDASRGLVEILDLCDKSPKWTPAGSRNTRPLQPALSGTAAAPTDHPTPTECDLADRFAEEHSGHLRYCAAWSKWLHFDGQVWRIESTRLARSLAKELCHQEAKNRSGADARRIASAKCVAAVLTLAQADRRLAASTDQWDSDPWLLNTPGGIIDLHNGVKREHRPDAHMRKITGAPPGGHCPLWFKFLDRIFGGDAELIAYMKRVCGYLLTGSTREHAMFFGYGSGGNGKSVFLDTVSSVMGDYATTAPINAFTNATRDRHPTELAMLHGARLVTAIETEEDRQWAESRIKSLTGGDRIAARFMKQDFFQFKPQFKLFSAGNHKPKLRSVDEAIRRRFNLIPFAATIPPTERDPELAKRLHSEWPGILQWMIEGCLEWQADGLCPPNAVTNATADYLEAEDALAAWLEECCDVNVNAEDSPARLYKSWKEFATATGETAGAMKNFGDNLVNRGFSRTRTNGKRHHLGLRVRDRGPFEPASVPDSAVSIDRTPTSSTDDPFLF